MTISRRTFLQGATAATALTAATGPAMARTIRWDLSDEYGAQSVAGKASAHFIELMKERAGDALSIAYQGSGALGYKSVDHFDAVQDGAIPAAVTLVTQIGGIDPLFDLSSLPFIASTPDEAYLLWQAAREEYAKIFEESNMLLLWAVPNPPSGVNANEPITSMEPLQDLRIRTYDRNGTTTLINAGASPLQVAWSDVIPQLSTGGLDAVLTSADGARQLSLWDYNTDYTELNYAMGLFVCHVNRDAFDALPEDVQQAMLDAREECDLANWDIMRNAIDAAYVEMEGNGMTVTRDTEVPAEVFTSLQEAAAGTHEEWLERTGDRGAAVLARFEELKAAAQG